MTRPLLTIATAFILVPLVSAVHASPERLKDAELVLTEMAGTGDAGIPTSLIAKARCIIIVPSLKKVAMGIGGEYGKGYMSCRNEGGWTAPGSGTCHRSGGSRRLRISTWSARRGVATRSWCSPSAADPIGSSS